MHRFSQNEIPSRFSEIMSILHTGQDVLITDEKNLEKLAVITPYGKYRRQGTRKIGILKGKAEMTIKQDFQISDQELLSL